MASVLTIAGVTINRDATHVRLNRLTHSLDRPDELEFTENCVNMPGSYGPESAVTLTIDGGREFTGWIYSKSLAGYTQGPPSVGYRCLGLRYGAYLLAITAADGTDLMAFNLPVTDDFYVSTQAGRSIGQILTTVFGQHSTQLTALGISTDATTTAQLALLTVVPPEPVYFQGNSLWSQVDQLLQQWYGSRWASYITPAGFIRFYDTTALSGATATLDSQPWVLDGISEDTSECYTQVVLRGRAEIEPAYLSLHDGTLIEGFTAGDKTAWKLNDYEHPRGAYDIGAITAQTSTTVTVQSDDATKTWGVNYWSGIQAQVSMFDKISTNITGLDWRTVTANTALTAGGTSTLTLDRALAGSGFNRYQIRGQPSGISETWRKYTIKNTYVAQHLVEQFNHSVPWSPAQNVVAQVTSPRGEVWFTTTATGGAAMTLGLPADFEVIPYDGVTNGYIRFLFPVVKYLNSDADLAAGTGHYTVPSDIMVVVPFSRGTMTVQSPSGGGYAGTAFSRFGVQRTLYRSYPSWIDKGNAGQMQTLADEIAKTVHDVVIEGGITYQGKYSTGLIGGSWPFALNIAKATGTTSYEAMAAPVRTVVFEWMQSLSEGAIWLTHLSFSTRRQMYSGDRLYVHPNYTGGGILAATWGMAGTMSPGGLGVGGQAGYGYEVMGTQAADLSGLDEQYTAAGQMAGTNGVTAGQAREAMEGGVSARGPSAKAAREAMEGPEEKRKRLPTYKAPTRKAQGLRGVQGSAYERDLAAEEHGQLDVQQRENTEALAARESRRRHMTMGFSTFASGRRSPGAGAESDTTEEYAGE